MSSTRHPASLAGTGDPTCRPNSPGARSLVVPATAPGIAPTPRRGRRDPDQAGRVRPHAGCPAHVVRTCRRGLTAPGRQVGSASPVSNEVAGGPSLAGHVRFVPVSGVRRSTPRSRPDSQLRSILGNLRGASVPATPVAVLWGCEIRDATAVARTAPANVGDRHRRRPTARGERSPRPGWGSPARERPASKHDPRRSLDR